MNSIDQACTTRCSTRATITHAYLSRAARVAVVATNVTTKRLVIVEKKKNNHYLFTYMPKHLIVVV